MLRYVFLLNLLLGLLCSQTIDTGIRGAVQDPSGAAVAGAEVTITNVATGVQHAVKTSDSGLYEVRYLNSGEYVVEVRMEGFRTVRRSGIVLQWGQQASVDVAMELGEVSETVEVSGTASLLPTENATLGAVIGSERIVNLPLNGRNFAQLATLTPGVTVTTQFNGLFSRVSANGAPTSRCR